ncbi:MAG TPA: nucleotide exchange factor GrpE [Anaerolineales bacterium]|nr:nucleotide exchange factor GrpE [Anaerolineales bacterium]
MTRKKHKDRSEAPGEFAPEAGSAETAPVPTDDELASAELFTAEAAAPPAEAAAAAPEVGAASAEQAEALTRLRAEADEYLDGWQRARAEFANYKKRVEREQQEGRARAAADILVRFLSVLDDMERAMRDRPTEGDAAAWADGIDLIYRKLLMLLEAEGVEIIDAQGATFDPTLHEAVTHESSDDHHEGQVIEVIQQGYRLGERVLRPALVRVAK